ncbi:putative molybdenum carrier protein [Diaphorobacter ruginosibacter]|uniref:Putative molybdenum carrier protein n=1 Tax=Diaphorobacter ruginosibacter TaxID=1715720 RepID=A0A7G9RIX9_9BURK|nr:putative molybdenum carrier protein [Diaphorobacter ruginosibacter]QNN55554.1 putative molybdenum carrier protein [Diaphorobacter ruginosibacter]
MGNAENAGFVPILTVMAEYGNAPFLWLVDSPDQGGVGPNKCDGTYWDESFLMSEGLWRKFADWAIEFDRTAFYSDDFNADDWDWPVFHTRGLQLSQWLKEEVGAAYRVVYDKPFEDPNHRIEERTEVLADGTLLSLPPLRSPFPEPRRVCERIVSGGQTGADRGALDFAIKHGYIHGGWAPHGRLAEDGVIPAKYQLTEMAEGGYRQRTRRNVVDSDATLVVNLGDLDGGTLATKVFAEKSAKPCLVVQVDAGVSEEMADRVIAWLRQHDVKILNVAGPRESKRPGIYRLTGEMLMAADAVLQSK